MATTHQRLCILLFIKNKSHNGYFYVPGNYIHYKGLSRTFILEGGKNVRKEGNWEIIKDRGSGVRLFGSRHLLAERKTLGS